MIELDGIEYQVQTPEENAASIVQYINDYCANNNITNTKGELIYIEANRANPLYMVLFGFSYLVSVLQKLIYNVGCAFNIAASSSRQLLNLADIAGIRRRNATKTSISCIIYAADTGPCEITTSLVVKYSSGNDTIEFSPAFNITIQPNQAQHVPLIANVTGAYSIEAGAITQFTDPVPNLAKIISLASIPGTEQETIANLRNRLQNRAQESTQIDKAIDAIRNLDGITTCSIYYNYSNKIDTEVGGITVPPRKALMIVQGYSSDIAKTFLSHVMVETTAGPADRNISQTYTTHAGQDITINFVTPRILPMYIRIYIKENDLPEATLLAIKYAAGTLAGSLEISQGVNSTQIIELIREAVPSVTVQGVQVCSDNVNYTYKLVPDADQLITINLDNIFIVGEA